MNKLAGANVRRSRNLLFVKARFKVCLFSRVGDHGPYLRLHCLGSAGHSCSYPSPVWTSTATQEEYGSVSVPRLYQTDHSLLFGIIRGDCGLGTLEGNKPA